MRHVISVVIAILSPQMARRYNTFVKLLFEKLIIHNI